MSKENPGNNSKSPRPIQIVSSRIGPMRSDTVDPEKALLASLDFSSTSTISSNSGKERKEQKGTYTILKAIG
jgi:hypothetical protein